MNFIIMVGIAPTSWRIGVVRSTEKKKVAAFGPLRASIHYI